MVDSGSNCLLSASEDILHNVKKYDGTVGAAGELKVPITAAGELHVLFPINDRCMKLTMDKCCVMLTNKHNAFGLSPFKANVCNQISHSIHD